MSAADIITAHTFTPNGACRCGALPLNADRAEHAEHVAGMIAERTLADAVSASEIAARLGVSRAAVSNWQTREAAGFPAPLRAPGIASPVWSWDAVRAWHAAREAAQDDARAKRAAELRAKIATLTAELEEMER